MKYCKDRVRLSIFNLMLRNVILKCNRTVKSFYLRLREVSLYLLIFVFFLLYCIILVILFLILAYEYRFFNLIAACKFFSPRCYCCFWLVQFPGYRIVYSSCFIDGDLITKKIVFLVTGVSIL